MNYLKQKISLYLNHAWYQKKTLIYIFWPLSIIYALVVRLRYLMYQNHLKPSLHTVPIVVVGNLTVGGNGKTPCVMALVRLLRSQGYYPGIVSRGYQAQAPYYPYAVCANSTVKETGDEPGILFRELQCPIILDPKRQRAVDYLLKKHSEVNVVIADDGLQHYQLRRDVEILVVDAKRKFGNELCLPAGPLREPLNRLKTVDLIIAQGYGNDDSYFELKPTFLVNISNGKIMELSSFKGKRVHAVAAIGNPERFFATLRSLGVDAIPHAFADHTWFDWKDFEYNDNLPIIMTAKDAIKCKDFAKPNWWYLQVTPQFNKLAEERLLELIKKKVTYE